MGFRSHGLVCLLSRRGSPPGVGAAVTIVEVTQHDLGSHCLDALSAAETESSLLSAKDRIARCKMSFSGETEVGH